MKDITIETSADGKVNIAGNLTFATVQTLLQKTKKLMLELPKVTLDLQGVTKGDSAGLALLLHWSKQAKKYQHEFNIINMPDQLKKMAAVCGLEKMVTTQKS
jgi:phospholipid transport system transporter-binding protein